VAAFNDMENKVREGVKRKIKRRSKSTKGRLNESVVHSKMSDEDLIAGDYVNRWMNKINER